MLTTGNIKTMVILNQEAVECTPSAAAGVFIRPATLNDVSQLVSLEERFWTPKIRASEGEIQTRIETFPQGQLVLVSNDDHTLLGVLYTQRLHDIAEAHAPNGFQCIQDAFDPNGVVWQLMAIAVDTQRSPTGAHLLRAAIFEKAHEEAVLGRLHRLVAVSRCSNFQGGSEDEYIPYVLSGQDPTLFFHLSGGAKIVNLVKRYRTADDMNFGYGVLVEYSLSSFPNTQQPNCNYLSPRSIIHDDTNNIVRPIVDVKDICKEIFSLCGGTNVPPGGEVQAWSTKPFLQILDSLQLQQLHHWLQAKTARSLSPGFLFDFFDAEKVAEYFSSSVATSKEVSTLAATNDEKTMKADESIAIVGVGMRLPCGIHSLDRLWECMVSKTSCSTRVPSSRWFANNNKEFPVHASTAAMSGCFVENEDWFDPSLFALNDSETEQMDPLHRMLLECVARAIYDSGHRLPDLANKNIGVWVGASTSDFPEVPGCGYKDNNSTYAATSHALSMAAGRVSYSLGVYGPSMTIDTACSSSLVAIDQACLSLRSGNCDEAIVAAANLILAPWISNAYSRAGMLSPTGECKSFDASADGYCRGEGGGAMLLKPLSKAIADGDHIHGLIRSSSVMHHGKGASLTAPNSKVQEALLRSSLSKAGISSSQIVALEAHGTGTKLGDPIEIAAIARVFGAEESLTINCVKANVGHLEAAAGMAGVFASLACMKYGQVPGQAHLYTLNENIEKAKQASKLIFPTESMPVHKHDDALLWSINSFGYSGTIANIVLEHVPGSEEATKHRQLGAEAFKNDYNPRRFPYGPRRYSSTVVANEPHRRVAAVVSNDVLNNLVVASPPRSFRDGIITATNEVDFVSRFSESVLNDHVVHGELVLAGACMIDIVCALVLSSDEKATSIDNCAINLNRISVTRKVVYDDSVATSGKLGYRRGMLRNSIDSIELLVVADDTLTPSPAAAVGTASVACFACKSAIFTNKLQTALIAPNRGDDFVVNAPKQLYSDFKQRGLQFGKSFRLLNQDIHVSNDTAMSMITTSAVVDYKNDGILQIVNNGDGGGSGFIVSPQLIDALFQLCGFTMFSTRGEKYPHLLVPFSIDQVYVRTLLDADARGMLEEGKLILQLKVHVQSEIAGGALFHGQVALPNGEVLVSLTNIMLRTMVAPPSSPPSPAVALVAEKQKPEAVVKQTDVSMINIASDAFVPAAAAAAAGNKSGDIKKPSVLSFQVIAVDKRDVHLQSALSSSFAAIPMSNSSKATTVTAVKVLLISSFFAATTKATMISDFIDYLRSSLLITTTKIKHGIIMLFKQSISSSAATIFAALQCAKVEFDLPFVKLFELSSDIDFVLHASMIASELQNFATNNELYYRLISSEKGTTGQVLRMQPQLVLPPQGTSSELQLSARGSISKLALSVMPLLQLQKLQLGEENVDIQIIGNSLNFRDVLNVLGMYPGDPGNPGCEFSGIVIAVGTRVTKFVVGDAVIGLRTGCLRSRLVIHQNLIVKAPSTSIIPLTIASVLPVVYTTVEKAFQGLSSRDVVLIHTAAGGVGFAAVQYAKKVGATVIATASKGKHDILRQEEGIEYICDSRDANAFRVEIAAVIAITGLVTIVLNTLNGEYINASLQVLAPHGRFVELGKRGIMTKEEARERRPDIDYEIIAIDDMAETQPIEYNILLDKVARKFDAGFWPVPRCQFFHFTQFKQAFELLRSGKSLGKVVLYHAVSDAIATLPSSQAKLSALIVTGGTGSLGILTIKALLCMNYAENIFVLSRNASSKRVESLLKLPTDCDNVHFMDCDVSNQDEVESVLQSIRSAGHSIEGVIHAAGIVRDGLIINGNAEKGCTEVWNSKVQAAMNLSNSTKQDHLKMFIMFSSIIGLIGRHGQSAYAAANSALDQLAEERSRSNLPATSIRWPAIANTGMAASSTVDHRGWSIQSEDFTVALVTILKSMHASSSVLTVFPSSITSTVDVTRASLFELCDRNDHRRVRISDEEILAEELAEKPEEDILSPTSSAIIPLLDSLIETIHNIAKNYTAISLLSTHHDTSLTDLGVDSLAATELANDLSKVFNLSSLSPTLVFSYPTVQEIAAKVRLELQQVSPIASTGRQQQEEKEYVEYLEERTVVTQPMLMRQVATFCSIIGIACRFPGGISNLQQLSHAMYSKQILVGKAPSSRYFEEILSKLEYLKKRKSQIETVQYGGYLDDKAINDFSVESLLGHHGNMTDLELQRMDLRQKLALQMAIEAIQDAGIDPFALQGRNIGVFVGALGHLHTNVGYLTSAKEGEVEKPSVFDATSNSHSVLSGRISFLLGLEGPSMTIDTACSSSLVALHTARRALEANDCEMALVIGVNVIDLDLSLAFTTAGMLSPDGRCHTFDESANGYCRGEGCGALLITRRPSSTTSSSPVYAVIKGSAVMQDGKSANLTAPNGLAQERLLRGALQDAGLSPDDIQYLEAHGTGTKLGDPIEIESVRNVYLKSSSPRAKNNPLYISSIKANLGHMEAAAGMAGIFAVIASLREQRVYPNAALQKLNPHIANIIDASSSNVIFPQAAVPLFKPVLHAAVSSFGYSGTIANVILGSPGSENHFTTAATATRSRYEDATIPPRRQEASEANVGEACVVTQSSSLIHPISVAQESVVMVDDIEKKSVSVVVDGVGVVEEDLNSNKMEEEAAAVDATTAATALSVDDSNSASATTTKPTKDYHDKIKTIKAIIKTVLIANSAVEEIEESSNLVDLGLLDSLTATELSNQLSDEFDLNMSLSVSVILDTPTIHGIVSAVLEALHEIENVFAAAIAEQSTLAKHIFNNNPWFLNYFVPDNNGVEVLGRLLVFGGMAHPAASWNAFVQPLVAMGFHVHIVRFPGRFERFGEPAALDMEAAIGCLCSTVNELGWLNDNALPLAVMGYSFGATMAYETARMLQHHELYKDKYNVCQLILLAGPDRSILAKWEFPALEDRTLASFVNYHVKHMGRMNPHFDADAAYLPTLLGFILEVFFRDVQLSQAWMMHYDELTVKERQVKCNLLCVNGAQDIAVLQTNGWLDIVTSGKYEQIAFPGDHFFVYQDAKLDVEVAEQMGKAIKRTLGKW